MASEIKEEGLYSFLKDCSSQCAWKGPNPYLEGICWSIQTGNSKPLEHPNVLQSLRASQDAGVFAEYVFTAIFTAM